MDILIFFGIIVAGFCLIIVALAFLLRNKSKGWQELWNALHGKKQNRIPLRVAKPEVLKRMFKDLEQLSLEDRLVLLQRIMRRDLRVIIAVDDRNFWLEGIVKFGWDKNELME